MDLQALNDELTTDPLGFGYSTMGDVKASDRLNQPERDVDRDSVTGGEIAASLVKSEVAALTVGEREYVFSLLASDSIPLTDNFKSVLGGLFPGGSSTRANLLAILKRTGSRAEELGLERVTPSHVADARRL